MGAAFDRLHSSVQYHVVHTLGFNGLRPVQEAAIDAILDGVNCVVLAPTAGGKTEAALLPLLSLALSEQRAPVSVLYVCPLKALLNNQEPRLAQLCGMVGRTVFKWHGDVGPKARKRMQDAPPDVLMTTPESLEVMLMSQRVAQDALFGHVAAIVIDEVHAFAGDDRGGHLMAVLERVTAFCRRDIQRIGLSATVGNPEEILGWLAGGSRREGRLVDPPRPPRNAEVAIDYVGTVENAARVTAALHTGRKRLVFADSRAVVEELGHALGGSGVPVAVIHASLSARERADAEHAFATWREGVIVSTSALELGIDIGDLDHVLQIGAPSTVSAFMQRMGRTGRRQGTTPNCTFLALERGNAASLLQAAALVRLWRSGYVEPVLPDRNSVHLLAHQLLALAVQEAGVPLSDWWAWVGAAAPFRDIDPATREKIVAHMLAQNILASDGARLFLGSEGERRYGRRHFLALYAVFETPRVLNVFHGRSELGTVDPLLLLEREGRPLLFRLAGRTWRVESIDWVRGRCHVEPATGPGRAAWLGEGGVLSRTVAEAVRGVLLDDVVDVGWTRRATTAIEALRREHAFLREEVDRVRSSIDGGLEWWTFAGGRANRLLASLLESRLGARVTADSLRVRFEEEAGAEPTAASIAIRELVPELKVDSPEIDALAGAAASGPLSKFQPCLPDDVERRFLTGRVFDITDARDSVHRASSISS